MVVGGCTYGLAFFSMLGFLELFLEPASDPFLSSIQLEINQNMVYTFTILSATFLGLLILFTTFLTALL